MNLIIKRKMVIMEEMQIQVILPYNLEQRNTGCFLNKLIKGIDQNAKKMQRKYCKSKRKRL